MWTPSSAAEELLAAVEELRVADEELRTQNEELATAHLEVEAERRRYQELFDLAPDAYLVTNLTGIIDEANRSASRLLGVAREFLIGKALAAYIATEDRVRFRSLLSSRDPGGSSRPLAFRFRAREGTNLHMELTYSVIDDERGTPAGFRWIIRDVTEQERMARQIRSLNTELESRRGRAYRRSARSPGIVRGAAAQGTDRPARRRRQRGSVPARAEAGEHRRAGWRHCPRLQQSAPRHPGECGHRPQPPGRALSRSRADGRSRFGPQSRAADLTRQMLAYSGKGAFVVRNLDLSNEVREMATLLRTAISKQATLVWELANRSSRR